MNWYIGRSGTGRLSVVEAIPESYVAGPFSSPDTAFWWLEEAEMKRLKERDAMKTIWQLALVIVLGAAAGMAMAEGGENGGSDNGASSSSAVARAFGVALAGSVSEGGSSTAEGGSAVASGGDSNATGGNSEGGQGVGNVSYKTDIPRQAPGFGLGAGINTASQLKCFNLLGSAASDGTAAGGGGIWCWKQRDDFYLSEYANYAAWNMPEPASEAYCATKLRWKAFETRDKCKAAMYQQVIDMHLRDEPEAPVVTLDQCREYADERLERCERVVQK